jgi:hypothetical protein
VRSVRHLGHLQQLVGRREPQEHPAVGERQAKSDLWCHDASCTLRVTQWWRADFPRLCPLFSATIETCETQVKPHRRVSPLCDAVSAQIPSPGGRGAG